MKRQLLALSLLVAMTFGALSGFASAQAATISEREKNNTDSTAQVLPGLFFRPTPASAKHVVKGSISGSVTFGSDIDVYRVDIEAQHHKLLDRLTLDNTAFTTHLYYDENNNGRAETSEYVISVKTSQRTLEGMPEGTYFIKVAGNTIGVSSYTLTLQVALEDGTQKEVEPNNVPEQGTIVEGFVVGSRVVRGSMRSETNGTDDGRDYYRFKLGTAKTFDLILIGTSGSDFFNLYHDQNRNGRTEDAEFLIHRSASGSSSISHRRFLEAGEYILELVKPFSSDSLTVYSLLLGRIPAN